ncbi:hypothetical protein PROFUN_06015 [Planoprotostelium fungivorum]|uniref:Clu domain-containing protein n=1 Tax=Planoprotostelium fungivorum TaxID=1890364 RepID=A0A2P6NPE0_9EUKA|nr:hypothetical protein PROFUN_06015 [Planoprotostelium fungivorum]
MAADDNDVQQPSQEVFEPLESTGQKGHKEMDGAVYDNGYHYYRYAFQSGNDNGSPSLSRARPKPNDADCEIRDWNAEFQRIVEGLEEADKQEKLNRYLRLSHLAQDFVYVAKTYGKIIILERFSKKKTILPVAVGGYAGGEKYIAQGILFKFAVDRHGIYGGDEYSAKAAANELKGLVGIYKTHTSGICVPLMTLIDFRGFRLIAMSILPLHKIVYGSHDGGKTVHADDPLFNRLMSEAAQKLNIKGHAVGPIDNPKFIHGPTDIEGHQGKDGRYYVIDFQRVFPPERPQDGQPKRSILYNLFRPEFVTKYSRPLSSDAMSGFGRLNKEEHNQEINDASDYLITSLVPSFAKRLSEKFAEKTKKSTEKVLDRSKGRVSHIMEIIQEVHAEGISFRHLGLVRSHCTHPELRELLFLEMTSRVIKYHHRMRLRAKIEEIKIPSEEAYKMSIAKFFNLVLGRGTEAEKYWQYEVKYGLNQKFRAGLSSEESSPEFRLNAGIDYAALFLRIQSHTGVKITSRAFQQLVKNVHQFTFVYPDIHKMSVKIKDMNITELNPAAHAEGMALYIQSMQSRGDEADRLFQLAMQKFETAWFSTLDNEPTIKSWGDALIAQALRKTGPERDRLIAEASEKYKSIGNYRPLVQLANNFFIQASRECGQERYRLIQLCLDSYKAASQMVYKEPTNKPTDTVKREDKPHKASPSDIQKTKEATKNVRDSPTVTTTAEPPKRETNATGNGLKSTTRHGGVRITPDEAFSLYYNWGKATCLHATLVKNAEDSGCILDEAGERFNLALVVLKSMNKSNSAVEFSAVLERHRETILCSLPCYPPEGPPNSHNDPNINLDVTKWVRLNDKSKRELAMILCLFQKCPTFQTVDIAHCPNITDSIINRLVSDKGGVSKSPYVVNGSKQVNMKTLETLRLSQSTLITGQIFQSTFPHLKHLNLSECRNVTDDVIAYVTRSCPVLATLNLSRNNRLVGLNHLQRLDSLVDLDLQDCRRLSVQSLSNIANSFPNLVHINLSGSLASSPPPLGPAPQGNHGYEPLVELMRKCNRLKTLNISGCKHLPQEVLLSIADSLLELENLNVSYILSTSRKVVHKIVHKCKGIKRLMLGGCVKIGDETISDIADNCPLLEVLDVTRCKEITSVTKLGEHCNNLRELCLNQCMAIPDASVISVVEKSPELEVLELSMMYKMTNDVLHALTKNCPKLKKLNLQRCEQITDEAMLTLSQFEDLATLNLQETKVSDKSLKDLFVGLVSLQKLNISNCKGVNYDPLEILSRYQVTMESLSMQWSSKFVLPSINSIVRHERCSLQKVDFRECKQITDDFIVTLASFCPSLEELWLDSCIKLTDQSVIRVSQYCNIRALRLTGVFRVTDTSIMHLAVHNPGLQVLALGKCYKVTDASVIKIAKFCKNIRVLQLQGCQSITDAAVMHLSHNSFSLCKLGLDACPQITPESIQGLTSKYPFLEVHQDLTKKQTRK